jgi:hypothetical protein
LAPGEGPGKTEQKGYGTNFMNTWCIHIEGQVQGVGFRPYVDLLTKSTGLSGWVRNGSGGVFSDSIHLWIADTGNRRTLYFDKIPSRNFTAADHVISKRNFKDRDYEDNDPVWPYSVKVNQDGVLAITDTQYYRVLLWPDWRRAFHEKADVIIGQKSLDANGQNQFNWVFPVRIH